MKAQIRVEFIFGIVVFVVVMYFFFSQINTLFLTVSEDSMRDALKAKAIGALTLLLEDTGVGLADEPYKLSSSKVGMLTDCSLLDKYDLGQYKLTIRDSTSQIIFCGSKSLEPPVVTVSRIIIINGDYGTATMEMY